MDNENYEHASGVDQTGGFLAGLLAGVLIGGLAGAVTMWLLAPQSGKKVRAKIQQKTQELRDQTLETVEGAVAQAGVKARKITRDVRKGAEELEQRGQAMLDAS